MTRRTILTALLFLLIRTSFKLSTLNLYTGILGELHYAYGYIHSALGYGSITPTCGNIIKEMHPMYRMGSEEWFWRRECEGDIAGGDKEGNVFSVLWGLYMGCFEDSWMFSFVFISCVLLFLISQIALFLGRVAFRWRWRFFSWPADHAECRPGSTWAFFSFLMLVTYYMSTFWAAVLGFLFFANLSLCLDLQTWTNFWVLPFKIVCAVADIVVILIVRKLSGLASLSSPALKDGFVSKSRRILGLHCHHVRGCACFIDRQAADDRKTDLITKQRYEKVVDEVALYWWQREVENLTDTNQHLVARLAIADPRVADCDANHTLFRTYARRNLNLQHQIDDLTTRQAQLTTERSSFAAQIEQLQREARSGRSAREIRELGQRVLSLRDERARTLREHQAEISRLQRKRATAAPASGVNPADLGVVEARRNQLAAALANVATQEAKVKTLESGEKLPDPATISQELSDTQARAVTAESRLKAERGARMHRARIAERLIGDLTDRAFAAYQRLGFPPPATMDLREYMTASLDRIIELQDGIVQLGGHPGVQITHQVVTELRERVDELEGDLRRYRSVDGDIDAALIIQNLDQEVRDLTLERDNLRHQQQIGVQPPAAALSDISIQTSRRMPLHTRLQQSITQLTNIITTAREREPGLVIPPWAPEEQRLLDGVGAPETLLSYLTSRQLFLLHMRVAELVSFIRAAELPGSHRNYNSSAPLQGPDARISLETFSQLNFADDLITETRNEIELDGAFPSQEDLIAVAAPEASSVGYEEELSRRSRIYNALMQSIERLNAMILSQNEDVPVWEGYNELATQPYPDRRLAPTWIFTGDALHMYAQRLVDLMEFIRNSQFPGSEPGFNGFVVRPDDDVSGHLFQELTTAERRVTQADRYLTQTDSESAQDDSLLKERQRLITQLEARRDEQDQLEQAARVARAERVESEQAAEVLRGQLGNLAQERNDVIRERNGAQAEIQRLNARISANNAVDPDLLNNLIRERDEARLTLQDRRNNPLDADLMNTLRRVRRERDEAQAALQDTLQSMGNQTGSSVVTGLQNSNQISREEKAVLASRIKTMECERDAAEDEAQRSRRNDSRPYGPATQNPRHSGNENNSSPRGQNNPLAPNSPSGLASARRGKVSSTAISTPASPVSPARGSFSPSNSTMGPRPSAPLSPDQVIPRNASRKTRPPQTSAGTTPEMKNRQLRAYIKKLQDRIMTKQHSWRPVDLEGGLGFSGEGDIIEVENKYMEEQIEPIKAAYSLYIGETLPAMDEPVRTRDSATGVSSPRPRPQTSRPSGKQPAGNTNSQSGSQAARTFGYIPPAGTSASQSGPSGNRKPPLMVRPTPPSGFGPRFGPRPAQSGSNPCPATTPTTPLPSPPESENLETGNGSTGAATSENDYQRNARLIGRLKRMHRVRYNKTYKEPGLTSTLRSLAEENDLLAADLLDIERDWNEKKFGLLSSFQDAGVPRASGNFEAPNSPASSGSSIDHSGQQPPSGASRNGTFRSPDSPDATGSGTRNNRGSQQPARRPGTRSGTPTPDIQEARSRNVMLRERVRMIENRLEAADITKGWKSAFDLLAKHRLAPSPVPAPVGMNWKETRALMYMQENDILVNALLDLQEVWEHSRNSYAMGPFPETRDLL